MVCLNISDIAIITVKGVDYHCIIHDISKSEEIHLSKNSVLVDHGYIQSTAILNLYYDELTGKTDGYKGKILDG